MDIPEPDELDRELKMRQAKVWGNMLGMAIMLVFLVVIIFYPTEPWIKVALIALFAIYMVIIGSRLKDSLKQYYALNEELVIKGGHIKKVNSKMGVEIWEMPLDDIIGVFTNIEGMPNTLFVLFEKDGERGAENFYKHRIKDLDKFNMLLKKRGLLNESSVTLEELERRTK